MKILALEFSSPQRSVAVLANGKVLAEHAETTGQPIAPLELVERAMAAAKVARRDIGCVAVGLGPGSYTGIRGAIAVAQGWRLAGSVKLIGVSTVECLAAQAQAEKVFGDVRVVLDAQRGEFYVADYEISEKFVEIVENLRLVTLTELKSVVEPSKVVVGPEVDRWFPAGRVVFPSGAMLGRLAAGRKDFVSGEQLKPVYLRETSFVKAPPARSLPTL
jgi:tRNA threonylcarbamoyl adenosine modification protein YeaZ